jgi:hypothetical protein
VLLGKVYNETVDVYSYGMVLWELWTMETPFQGMAAMEVAVQVIFNGQIVDDHWHSVQMRCCRLRAGSSSPRFRPTVQRCLPD